MISKKFDKNGTLSFFCENDTYIKLQLLLKFLSQLHIITVQHWMHEP